MAVKIGSNIPSLQAQRRLGEADSKLSSIYEKLSSGQRINRASDDAAGLAVAKTLDAAARIFSQGIRNLNDGISYTSIAGGAVKELKSILYRQRELSTQSSNGTYSDQQRKALEIELKELSSEWNRVLDSTTFNGRKIFSASEESLTLQGGVGADAVLQAAFGSADAAAQDDIRLASTASDGTQGNSDSQDKPSLSADGRYVAFTSSATNLVAGDTNGQRDIFIKDLQSGSIVRVTGEGGAEGNDRSYSPTLSADGRYVAFESAASNLVAGDTNNRRDIFIKDLQSGSIVRATGEGGAEGNNGSLSPVLSANGRYVAFFSYATNLVAGDANNSPDIFVKDLQSGSIVRVTGEGDAEGNGYSFSPELSADGRYVAFYSYATNLVAGDTNDFADIFVKDLQSGSIIRVTGEGSVEGNNNSYSPVLSADGRYVAFNSYATNLVAGDTNGRSDIFVKDLQSGSISRVTGQGGAEGNDLSTSPVLSAAGRYVAFSSLANNLVAGDANGTSDIFVKDLQSGSIVRVTGEGGAEGNNMSNSAVLSADGRYVAFESLATNLVAGDTNGREDIFVKDLQSGSIIRVTGEGGAEGNNGNYSPMLSADGRYVAFYSFATNLVAGDTNNRSDIFVKDLQSGSIIRVTGEGGAEGNGGSSTPVLSADGRYVAFNSSATNLVAGDTNSRTDIFAAGNPFAQWSTVSRSQWLGVGTREEALLSQGRIDRYLGELNTVEGALGAIQARVGAALSNLQSMTENFRAAESRITDADIGQEAANLTRTQIVEQAAASVLAQANQQPQIALSLLRGVG